MNRNTLRTLYGVAAIFLFCLVLPMAIYFRSILNKETAIVVVVSLVVALVVTLWLMHHRQKQTLSKQDWNSWAKSGYDRQR